MRDKFESLLSAEVKTAVLEASQAAEKFGINIYLIGGVVRDFVLNNPIKDIDIAVEGDAVIFADFLSKNIDCEIENIQENLKTAKIKFPSNVEIDFASTREERYLKPGILPEAYNFGCSLRSDVKRRDFTINTLALKLTGEDKFSLVDFFNGIEDIKNKKIRILHNKSFIDDPSRIIRALKFKQRLNFEIESETYSLMQQYLNSQYDKIPLERIKSEFRQYFSIKKENLYQEVIKTNAYKLISENPIENIDYTRIKDILKFGLFDESEFWFLQICCLIINSDYVFDRMNMTAFEKKVITETKELLNEKKIKLNDNERIYKLYNNKIDLSVALFYILTGEETVIKFLNVLKQVKVLVTGKDLIELGFIPSQFFAELFDLILKEKLKGKLKKKEDELKFVSKYLKKQSR